MEKHYVYIIQSERDGTFYKGYTTRYTERLAEHNAGLSNYTSHKVPWKLVYVEECSDKTRALKREKTLKKQNVRYINWLVEQSTNLLKK